MCAPPTSVRSRVPARKVGKIAAITKGCNPDELKAIALGSQAAQLVSAEEVDIAKTVSPRPKVDSEKAK
jgi:hypothetical protein